MSATCRPPVGTWDGKTYRISIDGDCHNFNYRTDYFADAELAEAWKAEGHAGEWAVPTHLAAGPGGHEVPQGQAGRRLRRLRLSRSAQGLGRLRLLLPRQPRHRLCQAPGRSGLAVRCRHDEAAHQQPGLGARDPGRHRRARREPPDQLNADPGTTGFQQFLAGTGSMVSWWGDVGSNAKTSDSSVIGDVCGFDILPGSDDVYNARPGSGTRCPDGPNYAPNMAYIGWGVYVMARVDGDEKKHKAAWSAAAHLGGKDLSLWSAAYPSGFQPYRKSHFNIAEWVAAGYDEAFISTYLDSQCELLQPPERRDRAAHPRHLPVLQRGRGRARQDLRRPVRRAGPAPTASPPPGRRSPTRSAASSRSRSTRPRSACSGGPGRGRDGSRPQVPRSGRRSAARGRGGRTGARPPRAPAARLLILASARPGRHAAALGARPRAARSASASRPGGRCSTPSCCGPWRSASPRR